ncbi:MAG: response regulator [Prochloraceae cyanobacterium]
MTKALTKTKILVIDDHELVLGGTLGVLKQNYPEADFFTAQTAKQALELVNSTVPDLVVSDLSLPNKLGDSSRTDTGIQLLRTLMVDRPTLNLVVQSTYLEALVRIKPEIDNHQGGFTVADKSIPSSDMLARVDWALRGLTHTKDLRGKLQGLEVKQEWLTLLSLAFEEGLQDKQIAKQMCVSERTVRNYWTKIQDVLEVYPETGKNIRIQTQIRAREEGLID